MSAFEDPRTWNSFIQEHCGRFVAVKLPDPGADKSTQYYADFQAELVRVNATDDQAREASRRLARAPGHTTKDHRFKFFDMLGRVQREETQAQTAREYQGSFGGRAQIETAAKKAWNALPEEEREQWYRVASEHYPWTKSLSPAREHMRWSYYVLELAFDLYQKEYAEWSAPQRQGALYEPAF
jgi:hypothetical protein